MTNQDSALEAAKLLNEKLTLMREHNRIRDEALARVQELQEQSQNTSSWRVFRQTRLLRQAQAIHREAIAELDAKQARIADIEERLETLKQELGIREPTGGLG